MRTRFLLLACGLSVATLACELLPTNVRTPQDARPALERSPFRDIRQLTFAGKRTGEGYASRDGSLLVFQSEREPDNPFYQIYVMDRRNGDVRRVSSGVGKTTCGWIHPSGERVLFASTHLDPRSETLQREEFKARASGEVSRYAWDYDPHYDLFAARLPRAQGLPRALANRESNSIPAEPAPPRRLTYAPGYDAEASWSPDGRHIVFASNRHIYGEDGELRADLSAADRERAKDDLGSFIDIYLMDSRGGGLRRLTTTPGYDGGPFFSPDGQRIVFRRFSVDGAKAEIFTMRTDGTDLRQLTHLGAMSWAPFYHPSGDYVIFATNLHGFDNFELYLVPADGSAVATRLTTLPGFDALPAFSASGDELIWTRRPKHGHSQLHRASWDDALARELLGLPKASSSGVGPLLPVPSRLSHEIAAEDLREFVTALASDEADGRLTGTPGERIATSYVARVFRRLGLEPAGDAGYFQEFGFTAGVSTGADSELRVTDTSAALELDREWRPLAFSRVGEIPPTEVVFVGYGIVAPARDEFAAIDDYAHVDVTDRWVLALRYLPEGLEDISRRHTQRYASLRHKAMIARDHGARGILFVTGPNAETRDELIEQSFDASLASTSIAVVSLSDSAAEFLLRSGSTHTLADLQTSLDQGIALPRFALEGVLLEGNIEIEHQRKKGRNVLARLPAREGRNGEPLAAILVGAHVDHLGHGRGAGSLARGAEREKLHPGADDNASGVAAMLEIAAELAHAQAQGRLRNERPILFGAWSGEELGLLGSDALAEAEQAKGERLLRQAEVQTTPASTPHAVGAPHPPTPLSLRIAAYINMDMVGRLREKLSLFGVDSSPVWLPEIERHNAVIGLPIAALDGSTLPTDATTFYMRGVPTLSAFTGVHSEYHTPRDSADTLDYDRLADVAKLLSAITASLAEREEAPVFVPGKALEQGPPRAGLRVYLGTVPDYTQSPELIGLALSGVSTGGPADTAGLRAGDVITSVGGKRIENIYDYTYALDGLKVGSPVDITVIRDGETRTFQLTPGSRE